MTQLLSCNLCALCDWSVGNYGYLFWVGILVVLRCHGAFWETDCTLGWARVLKGRAVNMLTNVHFIEVWIMLHLCNNMIQVIKIWVLGAVASLSGVWQKGTVCTVSLFRVNKLKETLTAVQQLDQNMSNLQCWLSRIEAELTKPVNYSICNGDEIQKRLGEQQASNRPEIMDIS